MFVAIDRTSKFAFVELHEKATTAVSREFLLRLIAAVPYKIHTVLTNNGIQFTTPGAGGSAVSLIKEAIAATINVVSTSPTSSPLITLAAGSRPLRASHATSSSARHGLHSPNALSSIRSIKCRD